MPPVVCQTLRGTCRWLTHRRLDLQVEGAEQVPATGPAMLACRHVHHLWDGATLLGTLPRPTYIVVGLDWTRPGLQRRLMLGLCAAAEWPVIFRTDYLDQQPGRAATPLARAAPLRDARRHLRRAAAETVALLRRGELVVMFPEGYPNIDPRFTPKTADDEFLPFHPGFVQLVEAAQRDNHPPVPIIPTGFTYARGPSHRWRVTLRFGAPIGTTGPAERAAVVQQVEARVRALSGAAS